VLFWVCGTQTNKFHPIPSRNATEDTDGAKGWGGIGRSSIQVPSDLLLRKFSKK
ncbi:unnamed protein product, partial [Acidithrix sp. C25]